jgi:hypothetical protein
MIRFATRIAQASRLIAEQLFFSNRPTIRFVHKAMRDRSRAVSSRLSLIGILFWLA